MNANRIMGGGPAFQKGIADKPNMKTTQILKRLWKYLYHFKWFLFLALFMTLTSNILALTGPKLSGMAVDAIHGKGNVEFPKVFFYCGMMLACYGISALFEWLLSRTLNRLSQKIVQQMRSDVFRHLMTLPVSFFDQHQTGDIISHISYDIDTINTSMSQDLVQTCSSTIVIFGSLIMMLRINPLLVLVFAFTVPLSFFLTSHLAGLARPVFSRRSAKMGELNGYTEESISGHKTVKAYHQEDTMNARFQLKNTDACNAYYQADYTSAPMGPAVNFMNNLSLSLISVSGALLYLFGGRFSLTLGELSSFVLYSRKFSGPINELANVISELQSSLAAAERVFVLLDTRPEPEDAADAKELHIHEGAVAMEHIHFGYQPEKPIIHDLSLKAAGGSLTAIVGPTGAGKTTLINLLMRFYDPQSGSISIDGTPIRQVTRKSLRLAYAMVLQDTWLFTGTIRENIRYGRLDATDAEVEQAAKMASAHSFIMRLENGYDTMIEGDGANLSQGQRQLLNIARAAISKAPVLILDEATSSVDTRTERHIEHGMDRLMADRTTLVIAHRLSTVRNANAIMVLENGEIIERGDHDQLLEQKGRYYELYTGKKQLA